MHSAEGDTVRSTWKMPDELKSLITYLPRRWGVVRVSAFRFRRRPEPRGAGLAETCHMHQPTRSDLSFHPEKRSTRNLEANLFDSGR